MFVKDTGSRHRDHSWTLLMLIRGSEILSFTLCGTVYFAVRQFPRLLDPCCWKLTEDDQGFCAGVTKRCRLSWLTNSALVYEPKCGGSEGELRGLSRWVQLYTGAQINFGDLTPYLTYGSVHGSSCKGLPKVLSSTNRLTLTMRGSLHLNYWSFPYFKSWRMRTVSRLPGISADRSWCESGGGLSQDHTSDPWKVSGSKTTFCATRHFLSIVSWFTHRSESPFNYLSFLLHLYDFSAFTDSYGFL